ncbi:TrlF family AAA-like ATPase [Pseudomonas auratipiscis]|uniref:ATP-binding protein n=1 Tax=Pseudomonas auratipiscis TaxID=3115853 RepID=A0AB35WYU4_9PSED|nr:MULTISPECIES: ATP-binding protein [unclassified Pseudomonas]MEE1868589.1 ATP-binding protein [Pseudomonas sp. 120P]MEE1959250.1 ATP-binding protein [Pseudomonas sp. 119P]
MIGSLWNKWDLHLHSPLTNLNNNYKNASIDDFVQKIKAENLSLIGITNYFYFKENELEIIRESIKRAEIHTTVLGNIELRINQPNKDGEWINIHLIFAEHITTKTINDLLSKLSVTNTTLDSKAIWCSEDSFLSSQVDAGQIVVDPQTVIQHLESNLTVGKDYIIAMCPNGYGGFQPDRKEGRSVAVALEIDKFSHIIFGRPRDRSFFLTTSRFPNAPAKPVFTCSDAHAMDQLGEKYTWVKAKPNFQGLRQAIYEPADRVQQSDEFTERTFIKPYFSKVSIEGKIFSDGEISFTEQTIPLNPNMVAIIGGRGTGKSLLLDAIFSRLGNCQGTDRVRNVKVEKLSITLNQGGTQGTEIEFDELSEDSYSYLHVSQGNIHNFSKDPTVLSDEIKKMLGIRFVPYDPIASQELTQNLGGYRAFVEYWKEKDPSGAQTNTPKYQNSIIEKNTQLISTLTNPQNHELIQRYQTNSSTINENKAFTGRSLEILSEITRSIEQLNSRITEYNGYRDSLTKLPHIVVDEIIQGINLNNGIAEAKILELGRDNDSIRAEFAKQGINQDISSLLHKVADYQFAIDQAKRKITEIDSKTKEYHSYVARRGELAGKYNSYIENTRLEVDSAFGKLQQHNPEWNTEQNELVQHIIRDINIIGTTIFDTAEFYSGLERCINRGKFRSSGDKTSLEKLVSTFCVNNKEDFFRLLSGQKIINIEGTLTSAEEFFWKDEYFNQGGRYELINYLFSPTSIKNYLYVNADFTYKGKPVNKLSVGQRGTFYVCLKLATDPFGSPFIFDQPEDDLDNEFIVNQLVPLFNTIKKYRQVVIVTHNANLVVNSDAEQVIVADNDGDLISYSAGALEDGDVRTGSGVRSKICSILEGGHLAFEKRERKYGI